MDKFKRAAAIVGGVLFAVCASLLHTHAFPKYDGALTIALTVLGSLGIGALPPLFGAGQQQPQGLQQPEGKK